MVLDECAFWRHSYARLDRPALRKQGHQGVLFPIANTSSPQLCVRVREISDGQLVGSHLLRHVWQRL
jgi:hypothetical protein